MNGVEIEGVIEITPDGQLRIRTLTGTFALGSAVIAALADELRAVGLPVPALTPEQHRHDDHDHAHAHAHDHDHDHA